MSQYLNDQIFASKSTKWYTPSKYVESARKVLGNIDVDPASDETANQWIKADKIYTKEDDALHMVWDDGKYWMNPPFNQSEKFVCKWFEQWCLFHIREGIMLLKFVVNYNWFQQLKPWPMIVTDHRVSFWKDYETPGDSSLDTAVCFIYCGDNKDGFYREFVRHGDIVKFERY